MTRPTFVVRWIAAAMLVGTACAADPQVSFDETHFSVAASAEVDGAVVDASGTTFDPDVQEAVNDALEDIVPPTGGRFVAAVVVLDVERDVIVAIGSSTPLETSLLDQQRASGSTLKFIVDIAAADAGVIAMDGVFGGVRCVFPDGVAAPEEPNRAVMSVREATASSSNCAFGKLARAVGGDRIAAAARAVGIDRRLDTKTDFGFGANTVSLRELLQMVATVANGGKRSSARLTDHPSHADAERTLTDRTVRTVIDMTSTVVVDGTAGEWALDHRWAIAKTGTSESNTDAWIVGATRQFATAVWIGNPADPGDGMVDGAMPGYESVHGGELPGEIWNRVMEQLHLVLPAADPPRDSSTRDVVVVVDPSTDCLQRSTSVQLGSPGPEVPWIPTGGTIEC